MVLLIYINLERDFDDQLFSELAVWFRSLTEAGWLLAPPGHYPRMAMRFCGADCCDVDR